MNNDKYVKIVFSGSRIETYEHDRPLMPCFETEDGIKRVRPKIEVTDEESRQRKEEARAKSIYKACTDLTRLIYVNAWQWFKPDSSPYLPVFITLTFRDDIKDLKEANRAFTRFIKRLNFRVGHSKESFLKYVVVPEFQDLHRGGVVHYHALFFNLEFIWKSELEEVWEEGFAKIRKIDNLDKADTRLRFQNLIFEENIEFLNENFGNAKLTPIYKLYQSFLTDKSQLVTLQGIEAYSFSTGFVWYSPLGKLGAPFHILSLFDSLSEANASSGSQKLRPLRSLNFCDPR